MITAIASTMIPRPQLTVLNLQAHTTAIDFISDIIEVDSIIADLVEADNFIVDLLKADKTRTTIKLDTARIANSIDLGSTAIAFSAVINFIVLDFINSAINFIHFNAARTTNIITTNIEYQFSTSNFIKIGTIWI